MIIKNKTPNEDIDKSFKIYDINEIEYLTAKKFYKNIKI